MPPLRLLGQLEAYWHY